MELPFTLAFCCFVNETMRRLLDVEKASGLVWEMEDLFDHTAPLSDSESDEFDDEIDYPSFVLDYEG